ncbi:MAG: hypothetical protein AVO33_02090 [delta proteobacterium ML8_F1]|nr:MAG: hypothetical protein AVO33_02090 [delta proteobacterium ML8_F1]
MKIYLIRHGQTLANRERRYRGHSESVLTPLGISQIKKAGAQLGGLAFKKVYCSPSLRTRQTARALGIEDYEIDERLREIHFGIFEGLNYEEMMEKFPDETVAFYNSFEFFRIPEGESLKDLTRRVEDFLQSVQEGPVLLITHGGWMMALMKSLDKGRRPFWDFKVGNGEILIIEKHEGQWKQLDSLGGVLNG